MMMMNAVIFDLDGVLADLNMALAGKELSALLPLPLTEVSNRWELWLKDRGPMHGADVDWEPFFAELGRELGLHPDAVAALQRFDYLSPYRPFPDARPAILAARKRKLRIGVLSNSLLVDLRPPLERIGLLDLVDVHHSSRALGMAKPAKEAYRAISAALQTTPEQCLYLDDDPRFVKGAAEAGMQAFHVERSRSASELPQRVVHSLFVLTELLDALHPKADSEGVTHG